MPTCLARYGLGLLLAVLFSSCSAKLLAADVGRTHTLPQPIRLMWQVQPSITDEELAEVKSKGFNLVQSFSLTALNDADLDTYLRRMRAAGFGVVLTLQTFLQKDSSGHWVERFEEERLKRFIERWKSHDAVLAWHMIDEPALKRFSRGFQNRVYQFLKAADPTRSVLASWNGIDRKDFECCFAPDALDFLDIHAYVNGVSLNRQQLLIDNFKKYGRIGRNVPVLLTVRAFNGPGWKPLLEHQMQQQIDLATSNHFYNIGVYGWRLHPNVGISQQAGLTREFQALRFH